jgi:hypothetical protein
MLLFPDQRGYFADELSGSSVSAKLTVPCCRNMTPAMFLLYWPGLDTWFMSIAHPRSAGRSQQHSNC